MYEENVNSREMHLGFMLLGRFRGMNTWRHPDVFPDAGTNLQFNINIAKMAEKAHLDFIFVPDFLYVNSESAPQYINRFEPITVLSNIAAHTNKIGLVGTVSTTYSHPFSVARQISSLDHISNGRVGMNAVTSMLKNSNLNYSQKVSPDRKTRYAMSDEFLTVLKALWSSWEEGALVGDKKTGVFVDQDKIHPVNFEGDFFSVKGPLNISRSPQGAPVIFHPGVSDESVSFSIKHADAIFTQHHTLEDAKKFYSQTKEKLIANGRKKNDLLIFRAVSFLVGEDEEDLQNKYEEVAQFESNEEMLKFLSFHFDYDFLQHSLDDLFPVAEIRNKGLKERDMLTASTLLKFEGKTIREFLADREKKFSVISGTPKTIADKLSQWLLEEAADGFIVVPVHPSSLELFTEKVVPILVKRGLFRQKYSGITIREHLGLE